MIRTILLHVDYVVHPWDHPITDRKAVLPVDWLGTTHHNSGKKRLSERPYPIQISH